MKKLLIIGVILFVCGTVSAQDFTVVLQQIEQNNTSLKALREQVDADKMASRTSLAPADPEVEVNYLWGNAVAEGNRFDLNAMQQFDFPTAYYYRKKIAEGRCSEAEWQYAIGRRRVLQQAELCCVEWVYRNDDEDFYVDLVFYNSILKCYVLIDLKLGKLTHQDVGQMDSYIRMFDDLMKQPDDNPTIGLILCSEKNEAVARYSVLNDAKQMFASKYRLTLPTEEELQAELTEARKVLEK